MITFVSLLCCYC